MFFTLNGLGALPATPPTLAGQQWVRYLVSPDTQWTTCPPNPPYGCTLYQGYAWGKRPASVGDEFPFVYIKVASSTSTSTPVTDQQKCEAAWRAWAQTHPAEARCLSKTDMKQLVAWCVQWKSGALSVASYGKKTSSLIESNCRKQSCRDDLAAWRKANPKEDACLTGDDRIQIYRWCVRMKSGDMTQERYLRRVYDLVATRCKAPTSAPSGGGGTTPAPGDVLPSGGPVHDEGAGAPAEPSGASSLLRQVGPVVGIGLLIALGLTVASQQKKGKRRKRG